MKSPTSYQGGKARIAPAIVAKLLETEANHFYDLCCGSGAISLELITRGIAPKQITMVDAGPWGLFWEQVGGGVFDLDLFGNYISELPRNPSDIQAYVKALSKQPASKDTPYVFLILQAASFGSKPIWIENNNWKNCSFRSYWKPTPTSNRRSPVNPMMPMPDTLLSRVSTICKRLEGVDGRHCDIMEVVPRPNSVVYIDPPYRNTTGYGHDIDLSEVCAKFKDIGYLSEGIQVTQDAELLVTSAKRKKGGISGTRAKANEEWLNKL